MFVVLITDVDLLGAFVVELAGFPQRVVAEARCQEEDLRHDRQWLKIVSTLKQIE